MVYLVESLEDISLNHTHPITIVMTYLDIMVSLIPRGHRGLEAEQDMNYKML